MELEEKQGLVKSQLKHAIQASKEAWAEILEVVKLADPAIRTSGDAAPLFEDASRFDPKDLDNFEQKMLKPYRASVAHFSASYAAKRQELEALCG